MYNHSGKTELSGLTETPYDGGTFKVDIHIPEKYPFEPPRCQFLTRVYHPNIDDQGRICLNILKGPPKGTWGPAISITTLLISLRILLANPNPDDPLLADVASEFNENRDLFNQKARDFTKQYAMSGTYSVAEDPLPELDTGAEKLTVASFEELDATSTSSTSKNPSTSTSSDYVPSLIPSTLLSPTTLSSATDYSIPVSVPTTEAAGKRSLARPHLKKPVLQSKRSCTPVDGESIINTQQTTTSSLSILSHHLTVEADDSKHQEQDYNELDSSKVGAESLVVHTKTSTDTQDPIYPSLEDTVARVDAVAVPLPRKRGPVPKEEKHPTTVIKSTKSKKARMHATSPQSAPEPLTHASQASGSPSTPLLGSSMSGSQSTTPEFLWPDTTPVVSSSNLLRKTSGNQPSKTRKRISGPKSPLSPLQSVDTPHVQSRYFSSQNIQAPVVSQLEYRSSGNSGEGKDESMSVEKAVQETRRDKGKGKAIDNMLLVQGVMETDENENVAAAINTAAAAVDRPVCKLDRSRSFETKSVIMTSSSVILEHSAPLTTARKRDLLRKHRP
ncbi:Ubiquitin-conjugating enzyme E2 T [Dissophora globulifera]|uniref:Ubiquitin-conjugating enzyme E2 T n=1 Tax=Dissophora globulifera TaxID=979702 RepID=A0A9P6RIF0_9FUNG|nr:Ubiquitin-conjugating enzyme E2 T [Dissophora globulifera]